MNLRDFIIIYLACGAPFGVYYFLQNRNSVETRFLWLQSLSRFVFWIPYALVMVARKSLFTKFYKTGFDKSAFPDSKIETEIEKIKRFFENLLPAGRSAPSIFDFRETFERYVGLSFEIQTENPEPSTSEQEFYRITNHQQKELGEICLNRRNRNRLAFHQKLARGDFFLIFEKLVAAAPDKQPLFEQAAELFRLVDDNEALDRIGRPAPAPAQTTGNETVNDLGKEKWKNGKPQLTAANRISTNLRIISATTSSSAKD